MSASVQSLQTLVSGLDLDPNSNLCVESADPFLVPRLRFNRIHPHPGAQTLALCDKRRDVFFGGEGGGGKSRVLLLAALQFADVPGYSALFLRKTFSDLVLPGAALDVAHELLDGVPGVHWKGSTNTFLFDTGTDIPGSLTFAHLNDPQAHEKYRGAELHFICVAPETEIVMGDRSYRRIDHVKPGDMVLTLEGPRRVLASRPTPANARVQVQFDDSVETISARHPVLHADGSWRSLGLAVAAPTQPRLRRRTVATSVATRLASRLRRAWTRSGRLQDGGSDREFRPGAADPATDDVVSMVQLTRHAPSRGRSHEAECVPLASATPDCRDDCQPSRRSDDAPPRRVSAGGRAHTPSPDDAAASASTTTPPDGPGRIRRRSRAGSHTYPHPYTMEERQACEPFGPAPARISRADDGDLWDIEVEGANHYLTRGGIVARNCIDEVTHVPEHQALFLFQRLRRPSNPEGTLPLSLDGLTAADVPLRYRSAANPGGRYVDWVRERWVDPDTRHATSVHYQITRADNPSIDAEEYELSLDYLDEAERRRMKFGDWSAVEAGKMFNRLWFKPVPGYPRGGPLVRYWDCAATEAIGGNDPDWTVGLLATYVDGVMTIIDVIRERVGAADVERLIENTALTDPPGTLCAWEEEGGSNGKLLSSHRKRRLAEHGVVCQATPASGSGSKAVRARVVVPVAESGNIHIVRGPWNRDFVNEAHSFTGDGKSHDDQIDGMSGAFRLLARGPVVVQERTADRERRLAARDAEMRRAAAAAERESTPAPEAPMTPDVAPSFVVAPETVDFNEPGRSGPVPGQQSSRRRIPTL